MRVTPLGSGSSGNAYLIEAGLQRRTRLLVDAGFSARVLTERLRLAGCVPGHLQGVLVTHEHSDHILGLPTLMKRYGVSAFADPRTLAELREIFTSGALRSESGTLVRLETEAELSMTSTANDGLLRHEKMTLTQRVTTIEEKLPLPQAVSSTDEAQLWQSLPAGTSCIIGDIEVRSFPVSHDAVAPCGYLLCAGGCRVCIVTDSGEVTSPMLEAIAQADLLILESNHDRARLLSGPYPYHLKQRILSPTGHLSNAQAAEAVLRTWSSDGLRWLWLAHLSRTNNTPKLALTSMRKSLREAGANLAQIHISALGREPGTSWDSTRLWRDTHVWDM
ncbi:MAG TPA: MBL fold metallo-hydrolase [Ktedonobacteraceae bacterium]|nr:MBL fold metallo-hydrolase [Ktedonobacteraceae bacterium]